MCSHRQAANYHWNLVLDAWWWSAELRAMYGVATHLTPSTELLVGLTEPEDRDLIVEALRWAKDTADPFSCALRIRRAADGQPRRVVLVGEVSQDESGAAQAIHGFVVDVTEGLPQESLEAENQRLREELARLRAQLARTSDGGGSPEPAVLMLAGQIDLASRIPFTKAIQDAIGTASDDVYLDLSEVMFIDVGGVEVLLQAAASLPAGRRLVVLEPRHGLGRILGRLRLTPPPNLVLVRAAG